MTGIRLLAALAAVIVGWLGSGSAQARQPENPISVSVVPDRTEVAPGAQFVVAIVFEHSDGFHTWPNKPVIPPELKGLDPYPTEVKDVDAPAGLTVHVDFIQWPTAHEVVTGAFSSTPTKVLSYSGNAVAYLPITVSPTAAPGPVELSFTFSYLACDARVCLMPQAETMKVQVQVASNPTTGPSAGLFNGFDPTVWSRIAAGAATGDPGLIPQAEAADRDYDFDFLGWKITLRGNAYAVILLIAFVAGFLLNLTPCVLPVIPIKVMSLQQQAGNPAKLALYGTVYCVGIIATFAVFGLLIFGLITGGQKQDWGQIFTQRWFVIAMSLVVAIMGVGMMGLFTIRLPQSAYMLNPSHDSVTGNFLLGVLTAILSTPCTGPFLGATVAWAATRPAWLGLATFIVMGAGMASPYALLIVFPKLIDRMPRSGPGGEVLKQVLGIFLLAVAAFLASNLTHEKWTWYVVGGLAAVALLWLIVQSWRLLKSRRAQIACSVFAIAGLPITVAITAALVRPGPIAWTVFANKPDDAIREAVRLANADHKTVVMDFTAKWCSNCHYIEKETLNSELGRKLLNSPDVVPIKVDLTSAAQTQGWGVVREISGGGGIPLIAVFVPGRAKPIYFQSFFKASDLEKAVRGAGSKNAS